MPKLPVVTANEAIKAFNKIGFEVVRTEGSHRTMKRDGHPFVLTIPSHGSEILKRGLLRSLIRNADITVDGFIDLLG